MNKARFLELVNLAIDNEISAPESAELEAELRVNAEYRKIYEQYCRLHKATVVLFESAREGAPASPRLARDLSAATKTVFAGHAKPSWWLPVGAIGTLAAAAFAIVVTKQSEPSFRGSATVAVASPEAAVEASPAVASVAQPTPEQVVISFNQSPDALAVHQQVKMRPINKVQNQSFVFSPEWQKLQEEQAQGLKLQPIQKQESEEMTALQFKR
ncbi:MAG: hypothetical protein SFV32_14160 [Opitutaceae bacterium]|nr:hypothetical protein [Opitutaceae bacterium]